MNIFGHTYVASKILGKLNPTIGIGSHLNDIVPFVPDSVFTFEEIHESPERLLTFLEQKYPKQRDLALAMMTHSVKFGADKCNREIDNWLLKGNTNFENKIAQEIADCSKVSLEVAKNFRMHNYLWAGVDIYLMKVKPEFISDFVKAHEKRELIETARVLSECFKKDEHRVLAELEHLFKIMDMYGVKEFSTIHGLTKAWKVIMSGLPEKDDVDLKKTERLFEYIYASFESKWEGILDFVINDVKKRMHKYI